MGSTAADRPNNCYPNDIVCYARLYNCYYGRFCRRQSHFRPSVSVSCKLFVHFQNIQKKINQTFDSILSAFHQEIHVTDAGGQSVILSFVLNAFIGALALRFIVGRTKLCLDFSCTYHFIHLMVCWIYNGTFPSTFSWWFLNAVCATLMCVFGEFLCLKIELKEIPVGYTPLDTKADL